MPDTDATVFVSYRRHGSSAMAHLVCTELVAHGFDVFMDTRNLGSGEFAPELEREIAARTHFVLILEPCSLDRIAEDGDWLRREITHALAHGRNVVPFLTGGASMPRAEDLPPDLADLPTLNYVAAYHEYLDEALEVLRDRHLRSTGPPAAPLLTAESKSARRLSREVELRWTAVPGATRYVLERANNPGFNPVHTRYDGVERVFVDRFTLIGPWFYRARAERGELVSDWSSAQRVW